MNIFSNIKERILHHIDVLGISKREFYKQTGISNGLLDKPGGVSETILEKYISVYPEISAQWLLSGEGEMFLEEGAKEAAEHAPTFNTPNLFVLIQRLRNATDPEEKSVVHDQLVQQVGEKIEEIGFLKDEINRLQKDLIRVAKKL